MGIDFSRTGWEYSRAGGALRTGSTSDGTEKGVATAGTKISAPLTQPSRARLVAFLAARDELARFRRVRQRYGNSPPAAAGIRTRTQGPAAAVGSISLRSHPQLVKFRLGPIG